jgi:hypothetical protein
MEGVSRLCAVLHAHSHFLHPIHTVVSTKTPILSSDRIFFGAALVLEENPVTAVPTSAAVFKKLRRDWFAISTS